MKLPNKSIIICLMILATAPDIHTRDIQKSGDPETLLEFHKELPVFGSGVLPNQVPIAAYASYSSTFHLTVQIQTKKRCGWSFSIEKDALVSVDAFKQFAGSRIIVLWSAQLPDKGVTRVSVFDIERCTEVEKERAEFPWPRGKKGRFEVVPFVDRFDVITSRNTVDSYDVDGNPIGSTKPMQINSVVFDISAVSETKRDAGYFIVDYTNAVLNLVRTDGSLVKPLQNVANVEVFTNNEQSVYSVCTNKIYLSKDVDCFLYDQAGAKKWNNKVTLDEFPKNLYITNLAGGGLVFAALSIDGTKLFIVEMGPTQANTWTYSGEEKFAEYRLINFNEQERTFQLMYYTYHIPITTIQLQKFSLV